MDAAAKPPAGPYHLFPFVPAIMFIVGSRLGNLPVSSLRPRAMEATIAWTAVLAVLAASQAAYLVTVMTPGAPAGDVGILRAILSRRDGVVEMAYRMD